MSLRQRLLVIIGLPVLALSFVIAPVLAATPPAGQAGQGLEISPPLIERSVDPGQTIEFDIRLRNITAGTLLTRGSVEDFVAQGEEGQPKLLIDQNAEPTPYTLRPWVKSIGSLNLVSQEAKTAHVVVQVPPNASPGGHYGVIRFSGTPPELEGTGVSLSASIGTLVLLRVSGDVVTKASVAEFRATQNGKAGGFFEKGPVGFLVRIKNEGNVHIKPSGTIRITDTFGKETGVVSLNEKGGNVLPQSIRRFEQPLKQESLLGRYKAEANIQYEGKNLNQVITFWVIPYKLIAIVLGVLILLGVLSRKGLKRYNQHIIKKSRSSKK